MAVYIVLLVFSFLMFAVGLLNPKAEKASAWLMVAAMIFVSGFREDVGMDYGEYRSIFYGIMFNGINLTDRAEVGFQLLCQFCAEFGGTPQMMFLIMSILTLTLYYKAYEWMSTKLTVVLFGFLCIGQLYLGSMNGMRQSLAIAVFMYALRYVYSRQLWKYIVAILIGATVHVSVLLFLPMYWLLRFRVKLVWGVLLGISMIFVIRYFVVSVLTSKYGVMLLLSTFQRPISIMEIVFLGISSLIFIFSPKLFKGYPYRTYLLWSNYGMMMCCLMAVIFSGSTMMAVLTRAIYYFMPAYPVIFTVFLRDIKQPLFRMSGSVFYVLLLIGLYIRSTYLEGEKYVLLPYNFNFKLFIDTSI